MTPRNLDTRGSGGQQGLCLTHAQTGLCSRMQWRLSLHEGWTGQLTCAGTAPGIGSGDLELVYGAPGYRCHSTTGLVVGADQNRLKRGAIMDRATATATVVAFAVTIGIGVAEIPSSSTPRTAPDPESAESGCTSQITRTVQPGEIRSCDSSEVDLYLSLFCPDEPVNVVLALIGYSSPVGAPMKRAWTTAAIDALEMGRHPHVKVGVVLLRDSGTILLDLTSDETKVRLMSNVPYIDDFNATGLSWSSGFAKAAQVLRRAPRGERKMVVYIGGWYGNVAPEFLEDWVQGARTAKGAADPFVVTCPWLESCRQLGDWWHEASPGYYFEGSNPGGDFTRAIEKLVTKRMHTKVVAVRVSDTLPGGVELVPRSIAPVPTHIDPLTRRVRWDIAAPITQALTLTYQVRPLAIGTHTFAGGQLVITDSLQQTNVLPLPTGILTVTGPCDPPTPTPTPVPPPTDTPTATSTPEPPTLTPTPPRATPSPAPTATRAPRPVFLPLTLREHCVPDQKRIDVVLVIDASTSMLERTSSGRSKLAAAQAAAAGFLDQLHLVDGDQAAVVAFNDGARVLQGLTDDRRALDVALDRIAVAPTTRLDLAIEAAHAELVSPRHRPDNAAVAIVLTDGKANPVGPDVAVARARLAKDAGVSFFTIGLGDDLDDWALAAVASRATYYYRAPDAEALAAIYAAITVEIPCPAEGYWGRR
jgi:Mg-chelatase subunit ChlD